MSTWALVIVLVFSDEDRGLLSWKHIMRGFETEEACNKAISPSIQLLSDLAETATEKSIGCFEEQSI